MKIRTAPFTSNLEAGFTEQSCEICGKVICHYDDDFVVIEDEQGRMVIHVPCYRSIFRWLLRLAGLSK